eukprot:TRINITY_DN9944_c0_g1_i2.p1 TRINITY_DN9944_c0_g1~~TRINITY_DN9944_c0_g1_i2.p1  ORF type:complete len:131 (-),score=11.46 TRINITY_DN9944_c0_g1_i2:100-492(-)
MEFGHGLFACFNCHAIDLAHSTSPDAATNPSRYSHLSVTKSICSSFMIYSRTLYQRRVREYIMKLLQIDFVTDRWEYLLGFVAASGDVEWARSIAWQLKQANKPCPNSIYDRAVSNNVIRIIREASRWAP